jgi:hypothetical protein
MASWVSSIYKFLIEKKKIVGCSSCGTALLIVMLWFAGFSQGATAAALFLAGLKKDELPYPAPKFAILVRVLTSKSRASHKLLSLEEALK